MAADYSLDEVLHLLKDAQRAKSLTEFADELGVSKQYLSNVFNGNAPPSERLLANFGYAPVTKYHQISRQENQMTVATKVGCPHCTVDFDTDDQVIDHIKEQHPDKLRRSPKNVSKRTLVNVILDKSGSMASKVQDVIGGFNTYVDELRKDKETEFLFTLTLFDTNFGERYLAEPIANVKPLDTTTYMPEGNTALNDAIGRTIHLIESDSQNAGKVIVVIMTDGEENSSYEYSSEAVRSLIQQKESEGWAFIFLGASPNAWAQGAAYGISHSNVARYDPSNYGDTFTLTASATRSAAAGTVPMNACYSATPDSMLRSANLHVNKSGTGTVPNAGVVGRPNAGITGRPFPTTRKFVPPPTQQKRPKKWNLQKKK